MNSYVGVISYVVVYQASWSPNQLPLDFRILATGTLLLASHFPMRPLTFPTAVVDLTAPTSSQEFAARSILLQYMAVDAEFVLAMTDFTVGLYLRLCSSPFAVDVLFLTRAIS
jgi:hypothetical protein